MWDDDLHVSASTAARLSCLAARRFGKRNLCNKHSDTEHFRAFVCTGAGSHALEENVSAPWRPLRDPPKLWAPHCVMQAQEEQQCHDARGVVVGSQPRGLVCLLGRGTKTRPALRCTLHLRLHGYESASLGNAMYLTCVCLANKGPSRALGNRLCWMAVRTSS